MFHRNGNSQRDQPLLNAFAEVFLKEPLRKYSDCVIRHPMITAWATASFITALHSNLPEGRGRLRPAAPSNPPAAVITNSPPDLEHFSMPSHFRSK
jgi:hypothetical protein